MFTPPAAVVTLPVLIHVHGGGWARGGKDTWAHSAPSICKAAASRGMIAVSVGYRRGRHPHFVDDAAMAVGWVRENFGWLGGDARNVFLSGHSAGAHIASLMTGEVEETGDEECSDKSITILVWQSNWLDFAFLRRKLTDNLFNSSLRSSKFGTSVISSRMAYRRLS